MPIKPPASAFKVEHVEVSRVETQPQVKTEIKTVEVIKEVEKIVMKDDPSLLLKLNDAYKELGKLKEELSKRSTVVENKQHVDIPVDKVEVPVELSTKEKLLLFLKKEPNYVQLGVVFILGVIACYLILK